jgi:hypothetical protein
MCTPVGLSVSRYARVEAQCLSQSDVARGLRRIHGEGRAAPPRPQNWSLPSGLCCATIRIFVGSLLSCARRWTVSARCPQICVATSFIAPSASNSFVVTGQPSYLRLGEQDGKSPCVHRCSYSTEKLIPENCRLPQNCNRHAGSGCAQKARPNCLMESLAGWFVPRPGLAASDRWWLIRAAARKTTPASISFRAAHSPRSVREHRLRRGAPPFPAAAAASCRFWPFWRGRARHAQSDNSVCASAHSSRLTARQDAQLPGDFVRRPLSPFFDARLAPAFR